MSWLIDWLIIILTDWWKDLLIYWFDDWLIDILADWLTGPWESLPSIHWPCFFSGHLRRSMTTLTSTQRRATPPCWVWAQGDWRTPPMLGYHGNQGRHKLQLASRLKSWLECSYTFYMNFLLTHLRLTPPLALQCLFCFVIRTDWLYQ